MKKQIVILLLFIAPGFLLAQDTPFSSLYSRLVGEPGFESTEIMPGSTSYEWEKNVQAQNIKDMVKDIESIRILEYDGEGQYKSDKLWKKMTSAADDATYIEVVSMNGEKEQVSLYMLKGTGDIYREMALIARDGDDITMITVTGNIDFSKIFSPETMKSMRELGEYYMKDKGGCEGK